jgi:hypothetical protein
LAIGEMEEWEMEEWEMEEWEMEEWEMEEWEMERKAIESFTNPRVWSEILARSSSECERQDVVPHGKPRDGCSDL